MSETIFPMPSDYPPHVQTVDDALAYIKKIFHHPEIRVERYSVEVVSPKGGTMKLSWDRENVGQRKTRANIKDGPGDRDQAFQQTLEAVIARKE